MAAPVFSPAAQLLQTWIQRQAQPQGLAWLEARLEEVASGDVKALYTGFAMAPRKLGKADLTLSAADLAAASEARAGWNPRGWSIDQATRALLVLTLPAPDPQTYVATLDRMFAAAEMGEAVALYQSLPLLPHPAAHRFRCTEGIRTNIKAVFVAVAHHNPFPAEQLDEAAWNQLVLKSLFVGITLDPIVGLDRRANATLRQMLVDFAHERRAAHRPIPLELWRCVGPYADDAAMDFLELTINTGLPAEQQAAALALSTSSHPRACQLLSARPDLQSLVNSGKVSWKSLADG